MIERKPTSITVRKGSTFALACHKAELISAAVFVSLQVRRKFDGNCLI